jgi:hypothetical protein
MLPDVASAKRAVADLIEAGIDERHLHVLGARGAPLAGLHEATPFQKSDLKHALALGAYFGFLGGLMLGLYLHVAPIGGFRFGAGSIALCVVGGVLFGAWAASLVGVSTPNWKLKGFDPEFAAGRILLMVDVLPSQAAAVHELLARSHPEAVEREIDLTQPALP